MWYLATERTNIQDLSPTLRPDPSPRPEHISPPSGFLCSPVPLPNGFFPQLITDRGLLEDEPGHIHDLATLHPTGDPSPASRRPGEALHHRLSCHPAPTAPAPPCAAAPIPRLRRRLPSAPAPTALVPPLRRRLPRLPAPPAPVTHRRTYMALLFILDVCAASSSFTPQLAPLQFLLLTWFLYFSMTSNLEQIICMWF